MEASPVGRLMALMARFASSLVDAGPIVFQPCTRLPGKKRELVADTQDPSQPCYIRVPLTIVYSFVIANHFPFLLFSKLEQYYYWYYSFRSMIEGLSPHIFRVQN